MVMLLQRIDDGDDDDATDISEGFAQASFGELKIVGVWPRSWAPESRMDCRAAADQL